MFSCQFHVYVSIGTLESDSLSQSTPCGTKWTLVYLLRLPRSSHIGVIPCQINQEFRVTSQILTKLGVFVVPVALITHANF